MSNDELKNLGFKCGVEIHQQLLTDKKLFCRCPAGRYSKNHHAEVLRHMRPTLSEMGFYDGCALMEFKTKKEILYLLNKESVCTYDLDDTPPFLINPQALDIAIELALLTNCSIVDEMHIARKQYLDGSIPTGFQRTGIVGINGKVPFEGREIEVYQLSIEEDSCREVENSGHLIKFRTDRLGTPLIEVVTAPCFKTPDEAGRGVKHIGRLLRSSKNIRRGIGSVRQDVNVSIAGGSRVEIKGVPRYQLIPALTRIEALRQKALLDLRDELQKRFLRKDGLAIHEEDVTEIFNNTKNEQMQRALGQGKNIHAIKICGWSGLFNWPTQPGKTFAHELSGRVRVIACLDSLPNIFHTDNYPTYSGDDIDFRKLTRAMGRGDEDVVAIVWGDAADTITATDEIKNRILEAYDGVPNETRKACKAGLTEFERILPGAERMYPDTDHPPVKIESSRVEEIKNKLPEPTYTVEARFRKYGLPKDTIDNLSLSNHIPLIDKFAKDNMNMKLVGRVLGQTLQNLKRRGFDVSKLDKSDLERIIKSATKGKLKDLGILLVSHF
ncbi:MAG: Glu-tRNA(Gln) amidotransferase subunit GatE [Pseudomonadota bacterium]